MKAGKQFQVNETERERERKDKNEIYIEKTSILIYKYILYIEIEKISLQY